MLDRTDRPDLLVRNDCDKEFKIVRCVVPRNSEAIGIDSGATNG
jgi:hypothetical protein